MEYFSLIKKYAPKMICCELCGSAETELFQHRGRIRKAGEYGYMPISICKICGFTFQNPRFPDEFYQEYYKELYREVAFGAAAPSEEYVKTQIDRGRNVRRYVEEELGRKPGVLLDHGCASGATMIGFREAGWTVYGIDPHEPSVAAGVNKFGLDIKVAGGESLPFPDNSFDVVISLGSLEHVYGFSQSMQEIFRTLKDDGLLFIRWRSEKLWGSPYEYYNHNHYRFFTENTWDLALAVFGFKAMRHVRREIEGFTGAAYSFAVKSRDNLSLDDLLAAGKRDDWKRRIDEMIAYKLAFRNRCKEFLAFADSVGHDPFAIKAGVDQGKVPGYRLLLGDPAWTAPRAILEAERYAAEADQDPMLKSNP